MKNQPKVNSKFSKTISILILLQGIIFLKFLIDKMPRNWDLNRTIGWGWEDQGQYYFYYQNFYWLLWIILFPILYWRVIKSRKVISKILAIGQVLVISIIFLNLLLPIISTIYLNFVNWIILGLSLTITYNELDIEKNKEKTLNKIIDSK